MSRMEADENCVLMGYYAAISNNSLPKFRDKILVQSLRVNNSGFDP